jgi:protein-S-isoprenylcysteine O-methyltransferase Ste14
MAAALSLVGLLLMAGGLVEMFALRALFSPSPLVLAAQAAAVVLMGWARLVFGSRSFHATPGPTEGRLVTAGPYGRIRHPIYTAVCLFAWAGVLAHPSLANLGLGVLVLGGALTRMLLEERALRRRYPEYADYMARTSRMIPGVF